MLLFWCGGADCDGAGFNQGRLNWASRLRLTSARQGGPVVGGVYDLAHSGEPQSCGGGAAATAPGNARFGCDGEFELFVCIFVFNNHAGSVDRPL